MNSKSKVLAVLTAARFARLGVWVVLLPSVARAGGRRRLNEWNRTNSEITAKGFDTDRSFTLAEIDDVQMHLETISRAGAIVDTRSSPAVRR